MFYFQWWRSLYQKTTLILGLSAGMVFSSIPAEAAEEAIFEYGFASVSVPVEELDTFAETGEMSPSIAYLCRFGKQDPVVVRRVLTQQIPVSPVLLSDVANSLPGEVLLSQTGNFVHTKNDRANLESLRGALIVSASDDNRLSLLELVHNYPTKKVYLDGRKMIRTTQEVNNWIEQVGVYLQNPVQRVIDLVGIIL